MVETKTIRTFRDLFAWQKSFRLGLHLYKLTEQFPDRERFGLISQIRRGSISVPSNIAEGYGRGSKADYLRFLKIARGALFELETQLLFSVELNYVSQDQYRDTQDKLNECDRLLSGLIRKLQETTAVVK